MIELAISRASLSLSPLVITGDPTNARWHLPEDGLIWPHFDTRRTYAPDSAYVGGRTLLAAVRDPAELAVTIYAHGTSGADLEASKATLETALAQWSYSLTLTVESVATTYTAEILLDLPWGPIDSGIAASNMAITSFSIPLNS